MKLAISIGIVIATFFVQRKIDSDRQSELIEVMRERNMYKKLYLKANGVILSVNDSIEKHCVCW